MTLLGIWIVLAGISAGLAVWSSQLKLASTGNPQDIFAAKSGRFFVSCAALEQAGAK